MHMNDLKPEIEAFESMKGDLFAHHRGKYAIIKDRELRGCFDTFDAAARDAIRRFGKGPYLIRMVSDEHVMPMPASVAHRMIDAPN